MSVSEGPNPFEPPKAEWARDEQHVEELDDDFVDASKGERFVNSALDGLLQLIVVKLVGLDDPFVAILVLLFYYTLFEGIFGRTPGKWLTRTHVVTTVGSRPNFGKIIARTLARLVPFEALSFLGRSRRGWHDVWSNTRVVRNRKRRTRRRKRRSKRNDD